MRCRAGCPGGASLSARRALAGLTLAILVTAATGTALAAGAAGLIAGLPASAPGPDAGAAGDGAGTLDVPVIAPAMVDLYRRAAATCAGLPGSVLAAIGTVESGNGTSPLPGVHSGANAAGAEGPMQFLPATFAEYARPLPPGGADPPSPYDPVDAVYAAARMLCANGAADGVDVGAAVFAYNHSARYVAEVMAIAAALERSGVLSP